MNLGTHIKKGLGFVTTATLISLLCFEVLFGAGCVPQTQRAGKLSKEKLAESLVAAAADYVSSAAERPYRYQYEMADDLFANGNFYSAYEKFMQLGDYKDAAVRAEACKQSLPDTGELYRHKDFPTSSIILTFDAKSTAVSYYIEIYSSDMLVLSLFVQMGQAAVTSLPSGDYKIETTSGDSWFGKTELFGSEGTFKVLQFNDSNEVIHLEDNTSYTMSFYLPPVITTDKHWDYDADWF